MHPFFRPFAAAAALALASACVPDDYDPDAEDTAADDTSVDTDDSPIDTDTAGADDPALVGNWRSEGANRSDLFVRFDIVWVTAQFGADGRYTVVSQDADGQQGTFTGTYTLNLATNPRGITMNQTGPYTATAVGLYAVSGDTLTFETVQTVPDYGNTPPSGSFGTSAGAGLGPGENVQTYVRQ